MTQMISDIRTKTEITVVATVASTNDNLVNSSEIR